MRRFASLEFFSICVGAAFSMHSLAQPYKCTVDGKTVYQQTRCEGGSQVNTSGAGAADPTSSAAQQTQREIAAMKRKQQVDEAVLQGKVFIGMTGAEVMRSWGRPSKINRTLTVGRASEQWIYRRGKVGEDQYVYLDDGVVTTIQSSN